MSQVKKVTKVHVRDIDVSYVPTSTLEQPKQYITQSQKISAYIKSLEMRLSWKYSLAEKHLNVGTQSKSKQLLRGCTVLENHPFTFIV